MPNIETPEEFREFVDEIMDLGWRDQEFPNEGDNQIAYAKVSARDAAIRAECDALKARCAELEARLQGAGWISVEERLPREEERSKRYEVIVFRPASRYPVQLESLHPGRWSAEGEDTGLPITHWMPLPKPPAILGEKEDTP